MKLFNKFLRNDDGLETIEYAVLAGLVVAGTVASFVTLGVWMNARFSAFQANLGA